MVPARAPPLTQVRLPRTSLPSLHPCPARPHPRVWPGCPALSYLQSHTPGTFSAPPGPQPLPSRMSQPAGPCGPEAPTDHHRPPAAQPARPPQKHKDCGHARVHRLGAPPPPWSREPAGEGQLLKQHLLRRPQSALLKITARRAGTAQALAEALRNRAATSATPEHPFHVEFFRRVPPPSPPHSPSEDHKNRCWSVLPSLLSKLACPPLRGNAESQEAGEAGGEQQSLPSPPQTPAPKGDRGSVHVGALQSCTCLSPLPREPVCLLCVLTPLPVPAPHLRACHLLPRPPPRRPSHSQLHGRPRPKS